MSIRSIGRNESCDSFQPITRFVYLKFGTRILQVERPYAAACMSFIQARCHSDTKFNMINMYEKIRT